LRMVGQPESDDPKLDSAIARYDGVTENRSVSDYGVTGEDAELEGGEDVAMEEAEIDDEGEEEEGKISKIEVES